MLCLCGRHGPPPPPPHFNVAKEERRVGADTKKRFSQYIFTVPALRLRELIAGSDGRARARSDI